MVAQERFMLLPAAPGLCAVCATKHEEFLGHNYWSLFYQVHFKLRYGRDATHADTVAHLPPAMQAMWRETLGEEGHAWSEPADGRPIAEPFAIN